MFYHFPFSLFKLQWNKNTLPEQLLSQNRFAMDRIYLRSISIANRYNAQHSVTFPQFPANWLILFDYLLNYCYDLVLHWRPFDCVSLSINIFDKRWAPFVWWQLLSHLSFRSSHCLHSVLIGNLRKQIYYRVITKHIIRHHIIQRE